MLQHQFHHLVSRLQLHVHRDESIEAPSHGLTLKYIALTHLHSNSSCFTMDTCQDTRLVTVLIHGTTLPRQDKQSLYTQDLKHTCNYSVVRLSIHVLLLWLYKPIPIVLELITCSSPSPSSISSSSRVKEALSPGMLHGDRLTPNVAVCGSRQALSTIVCVH